MNAIINNLIVRHIKAYIKSHEQFDINIFLGEVSLKNAFLDASQISSLFQQPNPYISCSLGKVGSLRVEIPWTAISSESVYVSLENCYFKFTILYEEKENPIPVEKIDNLVIGDEISEKEQSSKLVTNIMQNLKVEVKNIEIEIDIGNEFTLSVTADRIFQGPVNDSEDKEATTKVKKMSFYERVLNGL